MNPLEQLKDIHLPPDVSIWPLAWSWWVLIFLTITLISWLIYRFKKNAVKRMALKQLSAINEDNPYFAAQQINRLLKTLAIQCYGQSCAPLSGEKWLIFLDEKMKKPLFMSTLSEFAYAPDNQAISVETKQLKQVCKNWIKGLKC